MCQSLKIIVAVSKLNGTRSEGLRAVVCSLKGHIEVNSLDRTWSDWLIQPDYRKVLAMGKT